MRRMMGNDEKARENRIDARSLDASRARLSERSEAIRNDFKYTRRGLERREYR
jgi:hypothetical protein